MDKAGLLDAETFSEMCQRVLLRPEKKLVRAQLAGIDRAARRDPARAARLVADAATAFQHPDPALQERALEVIARHLPAAGDSARPGLRAAAEWLSPAFSARAAELLGPPRSPRAVHRGTARGARGPSRCPAPRRPPPRSRKRSPRSSRATRMWRRSNARWTGWSGTPARDRARLAEALKPATAPEAGPRTPTAGWLTYTTWRMAVRDEEPRDYAVHVDPYRSRYFSRAGAMLTARMSEAIDIIESGPQPFLLAVPTLATGALDAAVLVERLAELEELGVEAAPVDFAQALLRVAPAGDAGALHAAGELRSAAGQRLARWLRDGGLPHQDSEPKDWYRAQASHSFEPARPGTGVDPRFPAVAAALIGPFGRTGAHGAARAVLGGATAASPRRADGERLQALVCLLVQREGDRPGYCRSSPKEGAVVLLNDVPVSVTLARRLARFVEQGGGLFVAAGPRASWPSEVDLLPGHHRHPVDRHARRRRPRRRAGVRPSDVRGVPRAAQRRLLERPHLRVSQRRGGEVMSQVLARFDAGAPAVLERRVGNGRVLLWASALDTSWSDLPIKPVFLPFIHRVDAATWRPTRSRSRG